ncbi:MAG: hypothetical protein CVV04_12615 [Firmicutes bacterium HGW-Firmicutes-9]|jgi:hypothetical protein|nr:MAG: hypothetical protein CVV04_12615 [Firmicutes bacterium HGW-Firmicutes-9]
MKRRLIATFLLIVCLAFTGSTLALAPDPIAKIDISPMSVLSVDCGLTSNGGSSYTAWGRATSSVTETLTVTVKLYRVVGTTLTLITSGSNTVTGTSAYVSRSATLSAGSYRVVATATGSISSSASRTRNYTVS